MLAPSSVPFDALPRKFFSVIYADPPWSFQTWSHRGQGKGASRHYQTQTLDWIRALPVGALWDFWRAGGGNPLIDLATGLGKSLLIAELCRRFAQKDRRVLVLSHVREIVEQDHRAILSLWPEAPVGINSAALGERSVDAPIVLATVHSIYREPQSLGPRDLVLVDECHLVPHDGEGMYRTTIAGLRELKANMRVAGFSATCYRLDSGRLDEGAGRVFDAVVYSYGIGEGIRDGWLSPLVAKATEAEIDVAGVGRRGDEFISGELEAAADAALVEGAVEEIVAHGAGRRHAWLCFCCGIDHALHVRDALRRHDVLVETITADTAAERARIIEEFRAGPCLTGCNIFTTGFDMSSVGLIAMLRPTLSTGRCRDRSAARRGWQVADARLRHELKMST
jgi:DNA repair protein RadD